MGHFGEQLVTVLIAIVGLATLAVLVSRNAQTPQVIAAGAQGFGNILRAATSPVTGSNTNLLGPSTGFTGNYGGLGGF